MTDAIDETEFRVDMIARIAICGPLETGLEGVVFLSEAGEGMHAQFIPLMTDSIARTWPADLRSRLSSEILADGQQHYFVVACDGSQYHVMKLRRDRAEQVVRSSHLPSLA